MNKKILLIAIIITLLIIIGIIFIILNKPEEKIDYQNIASQQMEEDPVIIEQTVQRVTNRNTYFNVRTCVNKFYEYYIDLFNEEKSDIIVSNKDINSDENEKILTQTIYSMLDEQYISFKNINTSNMKSKLTKVNDVLINIDDMYVCQKDENISSYFVYGNLINKDDSKSSEFSVMINIDMRNRTFTVCLQDYVDEKYDKLVIGNSIELNIPDKIDNKVYNIFENNHISDEDYIRYLYDDYKNNIIYNKKAAYESLDIEYKKSRFKDFEDFTQYAKNRIRILFSSKLVQWTVSENEEYTQYVTKDSRGNFYIFRETDPMKYTILLDTYSIELPEFTKKYDQTTLQGRVVLNIEKFISAINSRDIRYIYSNLSDSFKKNKFKTEEELKKYIDKNLNSDYTVQYDRFRHEGEIYIYDIILKNNSTGGKSVNMQIIMQLLDERKYVMSFSIEGK